MSDDPLHQLYQEILLDHNKQPRRYGLLKHFSHRAEGYNPLCGDRMELTLQIEEEQIQAAGFEAAACAICRASASIMAEALPGKTVAQAEALESHIQEMLSGRCQSDPEKDGDFVALAGVGRFPARVKCATLPWHTFQSALNQASDLPDDPTVSPDK
ncbi:MAG: Fe-S cluster assembly sulfur transfer protein SufU [Coraliomargaritaceae bacterium]